MAADGPVTLDDVIEHLVALRAVCGGDTQVWRHGADGPTPLRRVGMPEVVDAIEPRKGARVRRRSWSDGVFANSDAYQGGARTTVVRL